MVKLYPKVEYNAQISLDSVEQDIKRGIMKEIESKQKNCKVALAVALVLALLCALGLASLGDEDSYLPIFIIMLVVLAISFSGFWALYRVVSMRSAMNRSIGRAFGEYAANVPVNKMLSLNVFRKLSIYARKKFRINMKDKSADVVYFEGGSTSIEGTPSKAKGVYVNILSGYNIKFPCSLNVDNTCYIVSSYFKGSCLQFLNLGQAYAYEPLNTQNTEVRTLESADGSWELDNFLETVSHIPDEAGVNVPYFIKLSRDAVELVLKLGSYRANDLAADYMKWTSMMVDELFVIKHIIDRLDEALAKGNRIS